MLERSAKVDKTNEKNVNIDSQKNEINELNSVFASHKS